MIAFKCAALNRTIGGSVAERILSRESTHSSASSKFWLSRRVSALNNIAPLQPGASARRRSMISKAPSSSWWMSRRSDADRRRDASTNPSSPLKDSRGVWRAEFSFQSRSERACILSTSVPTSRRAFLSRGQEKMKDILVSIGTWSRKDSLNLM
jgi:hypothetical protein